jgi:Uma2 family endonuclease
MSKLQKVQRLTGEEYLAREEVSSVRHEYVDGQIFAMSGANERHNRIALNVAFRLRAAARGGRCGVFISDMRLHINERRIYYYPDVMLTCDDTDDQELYKERPCLVAEVLSASTESIDRREKLGVYQSIPSLRYILLIRSNDADVEYYCRNVAGEWETAKLEGDDVLGIDCGAYSACLGLIDIYEDVVFPD